MEILTQNTINYINELIKNVILPIVVDYVNDHDKQDITVNELEEVLQLNNSKYSHYQVNKKGSSESDYNKKCIWEYKKGKNKGELCGKPTIKNTNYCSTCIKRSVITPKQSSEDFVKSQINFDDFPMSTENDIFNLDLEDYDADNNLFINQASNFIFKRYDENTFKIIGKADNTKNNLMYKLTHEDIIKINTMKYPYPIDESYLNDLN